MKSSSILSFVLLILCIGVAISTNISQKRQLGFDIPPIIYEGHFLNQTLSLNLTQFIPNNATKACLLLSTSFGTAPGGEVWIKLSTAYDFHYSRQYGRNQDIWYTGSQEFCLITGSSRTLILQILGKISGPNSGFSVYSTGYWA